MSNFKQWWKNIPKDGVFKKIGKTGELILAIILAVGILYAIIYFAVGGNPIVKANEKEFKKVQTSIDSIKNDNKFLIERVFEMEKNQIAVQESIDQNTALIEISNQKIDKLNKIYHEKIRNTNSYTPSQLDSFFRARYKEYYNQ